MIQPSDRRINLIDAIKLIFDFNETIQLDMVWKYKNQKNEPVILIERSNQKY